MSAMEEQWEFFVSSAKDKAESHTRAARFWGRVDTFFGLSLIFLSGNINEIYVRIFFILHRTSSLSPFIYNVTRYLSYK